MGSTGTCRGGHQASFVLPRREHQEYEFWRPPPLASFEASRFDHPRGAACSTRIFSATTKMWSSRRRVGQTNCRVCPRCGSTTPVTIKINRVHIIATEGPCTPQIRNGEITVLRTVMHIYVAWCLIEEGRRDVDAGQGTLLLGKVLFVAYLIESSNRVLEQSATEGGSRVPDSTLNHVSSYVYTLLL